MDRLKDEIEDIYDYLKRSVSYIRENPSVYSNQRLDQRTSTYYEISSNYDNLEKLLEQLPPEEKETGKMLSVKMYLYNFRHGNENNVLYEILNPDELIKNNFYDCKNKVDDIINGKIDTSSMSVQEKKQLFNEIKNCIKELKSEYQQNKRSVELPCDDKTCFIFYQIEAFFSTYYYGGDKQKIKRILDIHERSNKTRLKQYKKDLKVLNK